MFPGPLGPPLYGSIRGSAVDGGSPSDVGSEGGGTGPRGLGLHEANLIVVLTWLSPFGLRGVAGYQIDYCALRTRTRQQDSVFYLRQLI